jgi:hypothetical protein
VQLARGSGGEGVVDLLRGDQAGEAPADSGESPCSRRPSAFPADRRVWSEARPEFLPAKVLWGVTGWRRWRRTGGPHDDDQQRDGGERLSNDQIADRMVISSLTAKIHINRAMAKLHTRDRAQLVILT